MNHNGTVQAFCDSGTVLYWSNANAFSELALASANTAIENATFEGIIDCRLPTVAEFQSLYVTQGHQ
ncbi:MAG: hypothetical protein HXX19_10180 [Rhodoferax sp.]|nr:hypothetical protein [Rhodoferax sp.]